jgi:flagellar secretion chaperone FliS
MQSRAHDEYLVTEVMTATPQKLHLMLIDAALRQCERARRLWTEGDDNGAGRSLERSQEIVSELLASLNYGENPELTGRIAGIYNFVFRSLVAAHIHREENSLADAVRLLEIERETWKQIVERTGSQKHTPSLPNVPHVPHPSHSIPAPVHLEDMATASFSLEA